jgi:hypothetical protein
MSVFVNNRNCLPKKEDAMDSRQETSNTNPNSEQTGHDAEGKKESFVPPRLAFIKPKLEKHGPLTEVTTGVGGGISPGT